MVDGCSESAIRGFEHEFSVGGGRAQVSFRNDVFVCAPHVAAVQRQRICYGIAKLIVMTWFLVGLVLAIRMVVAGQNVVSHWPHVLGYVLLLGFTYIPFHFAPSLKKKAEYSQSIRGEYGSTWRDEDFHAPFWSLPIDGGAPRTGLGARAGPTSTLAQPVRRADATGGSPVGRHADAVKILARAEQVLWQDNSGLAEEQYSDSLVKLSPDSIRAISERGWSRRGTAGPTNQLVIRVLGRIAKERPPQERALAIRALQCILRLPDDNTTGHTDVRDACIRELDELDALPGVPRRTTSSPPSAKPFKLPPIGASDVPPARSGSMHAQPNLESASLWQLVRYPEQRYDEVVRRFEANYLRWVQNFHFRSLALALCSYGVALEALGRCADALIAHRWAAKFYAYKGFSSVDMLPELEKKVAKAAVAPAPPDSSGSAASTLVASLKVLVAVAMADGKLDEEERRRLETYCANSGLGRALLDRILGEPLVLERKHLPDSAEERRRLFTQILRMAAADGQVEDVERRMVSKLAAVLELGRDDIRACTQAVRGLPKTGSQPVDFEIVIRQLAVTEKIELLTRLRSQIGGNAFNDLKPMDAQHASAWLREKQAKRFGMGVTENCIYGDRSEPPWDFSFRLYRIGENEFVEHSCSDPTD
jgi:uncharacterized membrane protein YebE (DUF533 family)